MVEYEIVSTKKGSKLSKSDRIVQKDELEDTKWLVSFKSANGEIYSRNIWLSGNCSKGIVMYELQKAMNILIGEWERLRGDR